MFKRRKLNLLIAVFVVAGLAMVSTVTGLAGALLSNDDFDESKKTDITDHVPDSDVTGNGWTVELGDWEVHKGRVKEKSDVDAEESSDYRALLDAGGADVSLEVTLKIEGGDQLWGTVVRHSGNHDWIMVFHDGVGEVILGKKRPDEDRNGVTVPLADPSAGGFQELGRVAVSWNKGGTNRIGRGSRGCTINALAERNRVISAV